MTPGLPEFVLTATARGECNCGQCMDRGNRPDPDGHTADNGFFKVASLIDPEHIDEARAMFRRLTKEHRHAFDDTPVDPYDGKEHSYIELGYWLGDQGIALQYMSLGALLGEFDLLTPRSLFGSVLTDELASQLAGLGYVMIKAKQGVTAM